MSVPREEMRASPAAWIASSSWPRARRWPVSAAHPPGAYPMLPVAHRGVTDAALGEVGGYPATGELAVVELHGVVQDASDPRVGLRSR